MTKHEILNKLIPYYEECIEELKGFDGLNKTGIRTYLRSKYISEGICYAILSLFNISYIKKEERPNWISRNCRQDSVYWNKTPMQNVGFFTYDFKAAINALQIRVDIMKKELLIND